MQFRCEKVFSPNENPTVVKPKVYRYHMISPQIGAPRSPGLALHIAVSLRFPRSVGAGHARGGSGSALSPRPGKAKPV